MANNIGEYHSKKKDGLKISITGEITSSEDDYIYYCDITDADTVYVLYFSMVGEKVMMFVGDSIDVGSVAENVLFSTATKNNAEIVNEHHKYLIISAKLFEYYEYFKIFKED